MTKNGLTYCKAHYKSRWLDAEPGRRERVNEYSRNYVRPDGLEFKPRKEVVNYFQQHRRLTYIKGKASDLPCVGCGSTGRNEWSMHHEAPEQLVAEVRPGRFVKYTLDPDDYSPRCIPCHRAYDLGRAA